MKTSRLVLVIAGVATVGGMIAYTMAREPEPAAAPPAVADIRPVSSDRDIVLPFDSYVYTTAEVNTIERATAVLAQECMQRFGLDWPLPAEPAAGSDSQPGSGRYGIIDQAEVAQWGYHAPDEQPEQDAVTPPALDAVAVYAGKGARTFGGQPVPDGGCLGEARRKIEVDVPPSMSGAQFAELDIQVFEQAQNDDRVRSVMSQWRACMAEAGYDYADVWAANNDVRWTAPTPSVEEITTATTDMACRKRTDLVPVWLAVETAYQREAVSGRAGEFDALRASMGVRLENANRVLSGTVSAR